MFFSMLYPAHFNTAAQHKVNGVLHYKPNEISDKKTWVQSVDQLSWRTKVDECRGIHVKDQRFDCHPDPFASKESCEARGCCWQPYTIYQEGNIKRKQWTKPHVNGQANIKLNNIINAPFCYFPTNYPSYQMSNCQVTPTGYTCKLTRQGKSHWPNDITTLRMDVSMETSSRLHFTVMYYFFTYRPNSPLNTD